MLFVSNRGNPILLQTEVSVIKYKLGVLDVWMTGRSHKITCSNICQISSHGSDMS